MATSLAPPERGFPKSSSSGFFDIFRLAARTHGPLSKALEPLATLFAAVILAFHSLIKLDIDRSTDCTHGVYHQRSYLGGAI